MGLDLYVGPLTRYHSGRWQTVLQSAASVDPVPAAPADPPRRDEDLAQVQESLRKLVPMSVDS